MSKKKTNHCGFTLAEVLITLTIIGVIAALTIPNLMHKWEQKELEARFNKAYSEVSQGIERMKKEEGDGLWYNYGPYTTSGYKDFATPFYSYFDKVTQKSYWHWYKISKNYNRTSYAGMPAMNLQPLTYIGNNFSLQTWTNWATIFILIDTNGALKKPNTFGHDLFVFYLNEKDVLTPFNTEESYRGGFRYTCNKTSTDPTNGSACALYALINKCPDDPSKTYWECLP